MVACGAMIAWAAWNLSKIDGKTERSSINNLTGTRTREGFSRISQDSRSDIHVNKLDGHI